MATELNPDPHDRDHLKDPIRTNIGERRSPVEFDNDSQAYPELAEGPASNGRIAIFAVVIAVALGLVFYGLNNTSMRQGGASTAQNSSQTSSPRANTGPGITTGSAPAQPPATAPAEMNRPATDRLATPRQRQ